MFADMESDLTWKHLSTFTNRIAARLTAVREGKIFADNEERPAHDGAAAGRYAPTAAGEQVNLGGEEGTVARQSGSAGGSCTLDLLGMNQASYCCSTARENEIAGLSEARTAGPSPVKAPQGGPAGPLSW